VFRTTVLKPAAIRRFSLLCVCVLAQPSVSARSANAPIRLNPVRPNTYIEVHVSLRVRNHLLRHLSKVGERLLGGLWLWVGSLQDAVRDQFVGCDYKPGEQDSLRLLINKLCDKMSPQLDTRTFGSTCCTARENQRQ
jgi:hypothetical protein